MNLNLKKNLLKELITCKTQTYTELDEEKILELYLFLLKTKLTRIYIAVISKK